MLAASQILICDVLHDLVPFEQFKNREKHPWRSVTFSKVAGYQIAQRITYFHKNFYIARGENLKNRSLGIFT